MDRNSEADMLKQIKAYVIEKDFKAALEVVNNIDVNKIKNAPMLCLIGEVYIKGGRHEEAEEIVLKAYDKSPSNRRILNLLTTLYINMGEYAEAEYYYKEFIGVASKDLNRYILRYKLDKGKGERLSVLIDTLERLKDYEYIEEWAYELATLYEASGEIKKCISECDEIILWFGHGEYVDKAIALKCKITGEPMPEVSTVDKQNSMELEAMKILEIKAAAKIRAAQQEAKMKADKEMKEALAREDMAPEAKERIQAEPPARYENQDGDSFNEEDIDLSMIEQALKDGFSAEGEGLVEQDDEGEEDIEDNDEVIDDMSLKLKMSQTLNTLFGGLQQPETSWEDKYLEDDEEEPEVKSSEEECAKEGRIEEPEPLEDPERLEEPVTEFREEVASNDDDDDYFEDEIIDNIPSLEDKDFFEEEIFVDNGEAAGTEEFDEFDDGEEVPEESIEISEEDKTFLNKLFQDESEEDEEDEITDSVEIPNTVKDIFATVPHILDVQQQLAETFNKFEDTGADKFDILAPYDINFVVIGSDKSVKSQIAIGIAKALNTYGICDKTKIVRATAADLNTRDFSVIFKKINGGCLIIENADELSASSVEIIKKEVNNDNQDVAIILESYEDDIFKLWKKYPDLRAKFLNVINVVKYNEMELVTLAKGYIEKRGHELAKETALQLRDYFKEQTMADVVINYEDITAMVDQAIVNLDQRNMRNLFMTVLDNKYEEADMVRLLPQDFGSLINL